MIDSYSACVYPIDVWEIFFELFTWQENGTFSLETTNVEKNEGIIENVKAEIYANAV